MRGAPHINQHTGTEWAPVTQKIFTRPGKCPKGHKLVQAIGAFGEKAPGVYHCSAKKCKHSFGKPRGGRPKVAQQRR